jgi:toxin ParE1/3/4
LSIVYAAGALGDLQLIEDDLLRAGTHVLERFHRRLARSLSIYESLPLAAQEYQPPNPQLPGLRFFHLRWFKSYAVFYQPTDDGIRVVRVLHTSRNVAAIFAPDPDPPVP